MLFSVFTTNRTPQTTPIMCITSSWKSPSIIFHCFPICKKLVFVKKGRVDGIADSWYKNHWFIKDLGIRKSVFHTFYYLLSHCGIKKGFHALSWAGVLSYSKLKIHDEPIITKCPLCNGEFVEIYFDGLDPPIDGDRYFVGQLNSDGWHIVQTMSEDEMAISYRYEFAPTRELNEILKGLALTC